MGEEKIVSFGGGSFQLRTDSTVFVAVVFGISH